MEKLEQLDRDIDDFFPNELIMTWDEYYLLLHADLKRWRDSHIPNKFSHNAGGQYFYRNILIKFKGEKTRCSICDAAKNY